MAAAAVLDLKLFASFSPFDQSSPNFAEML